MIFAVIEGTIFGVWWKKMLYRSKKNMKTGGRIEILERCWRIK